MRSVGTEGRGGERERENNRCACTVPVFARTCNCVLHTCSSDNAAEGMFAAMETKDGATYDAMIQGLVKVQPSTEVKAYLYV